MLLFLSKVRIRQGLGHGEGHGRGRGQGRELGGRVPNPAPDPDCDPDLDPDPESGSQSSGRTAALVHLGVPAAARHAQHPRLRWKASGLRGVLSLVLAHATMGPRGRHPASVDACHRSHWPRLAPRDAAHRVAYALSDPAQEDPFRVAQGCAL
eukprot:scaffold17475_cov58-Phaeocystis_antarctica.AAC.3